MQRCSSQSCIQGLAITLLLIDCMEIDGFSIIPCPTTAASERESTITTKEQMLRRENAGKHKQLERSPCTCRDFDDGGRALFLLHATPSLHTSSRLQTLAHANANCRIECPSVSACETATQYHPLSSAKREKRELFPRVQF
jgi:hypothetical protein